MSSSNKEDILFVEGDQGEGIQDFFAKLNKQESALELLLLKQEDMKNKTFKQEENDE